MSRTDDFEEFAHTRLPQLYRAAWLLCGDTHLAEDLVQEALTKVALRWRRLRDDNPDAYARQILVRDNISAWRKRRRETVVDHVPRVVVPDHAAASERRLLLDQALATLTPRQRAVVVLRYYDDLTERAAADALGVSVGTVKSQTHLALSRLREAAPELAELLGEES